MSEQGPDKAKLSGIALEAERDLNTYQSKTGTGKGRATGLEDFGANDPGRMDEATVKGSGKHSHELERAHLHPHRPDVLPAEHATGGRGREPAKTGELSEQGRSAAKANLGMVPKSREEVPARAGRGSEFKGEYYEASESVPDQWADQNEVPPKSVVGRSKNL